MRRIVTATAKLDWTKACAVLMLYMAPTISVSAQTFTSLHNFDGTDGTQPEPWLVQATDGNFYGTTAQGGKTAACSSSSGCGTFFKITPSGALTTLYRFCSHTSCTDGVGPGPLVQAPSGEFYGTTGTGGANGDGTVFKITPSGSLTTLYAFCSRSGCSDGNEPVSLLQAPGGDFYGTTHGGGANRRGTVFKITPTGALTTLYSFCSQSNCPDGEGPGALVQAANGDLYGTTFYGGAHGTVAGNGGGTVFEITTAGALTTVYRFCSQSPTCADGQNPEELVQATDGALYGTTAKGGVNGDGTIFEIVPGGALTTLYSFCSQPTCTDGAVPGGLVQATDGNFYGTTAGGGANGYGTIFEFTPSGALTTLYSFCDLSSCMNDSGYSEGLLQATDGSFYGTTIQGGPNNCGDYGCGTVFSLSVGSGPFVKTLPVSGQVGSTVEILGNNLTGSTSVTFNGTAATFTVNSTGSAITTTVPTGATPGTVQVVTPSGTLSSNVPFRVP